MSRPQEMDPTAFGRRLSERIEKWGTPARLASILDVHRTAVFRWCHGDGFPRVDRLFQICLVLDVSADYLLGLSLEEHPDVLGKMIDGLARIADVTQSVSDDLIDELELAVGRQKADTISEP